MHKIYLIIITILITLTLTGCQTMKEIEDTLGLKDHEKKAYNLENMIPCPQERPLSCKKEATIACGILSNGSSWTYDSACLACTRSVVIGFIPGPCPN